jgi:chromate transporter
MVELALRFLLVGALAFGGGQAALPLLERLTVEQTAWLSPRDFALAVGLAYATPGPVLIIAAFVGYRVAGVPGGVLATVAVFAIPVALSSVAARVVAARSGSPRVRSFGRFAAAAGIGLLGVTLLSLAWPLVELFGPLPLVSAAVMLAAIRGASPLVLLAGCAAAGAAVASL